MKTLGKRLLERGQAMRDDERGVIDIAGLMLMGIAMVFMAVGFIIYPIVLDGTDTVLSWSANLTNAVYTVADFTGLAAITGIIPLITLIGFVGAGVISGFLGVKMMKSGGGGKMDTGDMMLLGIGLIFIAIGLIIYPVTLDGVASALDSDSVRAGTYIGLDAILRICPLLVLVGFISGGIVAGFFGIKRMKSRAGV